MLNPAANPVEIDSAAIAATLNRAFQKQRESYLADPVPGLEQRREDLKTLKRMLSENLDDIVEAISEDYGNRSRHESLFAEVIAVTDGVNDTIKQLKKWMKPQKRHVDITLYPGARNRVIPQPLGVVGLIIPWNFPVNLSFSQLTGAFAAGNRAMVKMSENSVALSRLLIKISPRYFPEEKLMWFEETGGVGIEFSQVPFDLMMFTGSGQTGRAVMASAAKNLTPVVLELGGKSPAIIDPEFSLEKAVERILFVKQFNAGQICTNVDYVFVHESQREEFIEKSRAWVKRHIPDINSKDYTSIIDDRSFQRLEETLEDAREKGATIVNLSGEQTGNREQRKMPVHLVLDTTGNMTVRNRETFGPILMVLTYKNPEEVIKYINGQDRPLALYPFTRNKELCQLYIDRIMSGGVTVNDALFHVAQHDMPFGGVGPSGMGHYHGHEGFVTFSKMRPVFYQANFTSMKFLAPPYGKFANTVYNFLVKSKS
ncbi:MAG: coniferyl aldehyde dehydrogenase [Xanthomonadales bacterium]|nr:coniferyl aldehyde dehydrogenase [Gammaproteobacteria bacterium]MBT8052296.1 coniferyl aldehyde dehydrogenase [Gammaproteobacteria bacterium]NND56909.1 coniferyl aldehyde dehydrogenase [Xanthomonadales bacterium]NNK51520.1 coniferyl aldehyde dehydrogenase [Xanthomonadales bacterium]